MKKLSVMISTIALTMVLLATTVSAGRPMPPPLADGGITFTWITPPPTSLKVGESYTIEARVESPDKEFLQAIMMSNEYYPGRIVFFTGINKVMHGNTAELQLTITAKNPTAGLPGVCDWPLPGFCTNDGEAPLAVGVGVRYKGNEVYGDYFPFALIVTE